MKPICKAEAKWLYWRETFYEYKDRGFRRGGKKDMSRARRRFAKHEIIKEIKNE